MDLDDVFVWMKKMDGPRCVPTKEQLDQAQLMWPHLKDNQAEILHSQYCYCPFCHSVLNSKSIHEWDENNSAVCPVCGMPAVLGDSSGIHPHFMEGMEIAPFVLALGLENFKTEDLMDYLSFVRDCDNWDSDSVRLNALIVALFLALLTHDSYCAANYVKLKLADYLRKGIVKDTDVLTAFEFIRHLCRERDPVTCNVISELVLCFGARELGRVAYRNIVKAAAADDSLAPFLAAWHLRDGIGVKEDRESASRITISQFHHYMPILIDDPSPEGRANAFIAAYTFATCQDFLPEDAKPKQFPEYHYSPFSDDIYAAYLMAIELYKRLVFPDTILYRSLYAYAQERARVYRRFANRRRKCDPPNDEYALFVTMSVGGYEHGVFEISDLFHYVESYELHFTLRCDRPFVLISPNLGKAKWIPAFQGVRFNLAFVSSIEGSEGKFLYGKIIPDGYSLSNDPQKVGEVLRINFLKREEIEDLEEHYEETQHSYHKS
ncbi:MAG: hypothetical protein SOV58_00540 [Candidatus Enteromonas sp.]|nr:hypothetical protein [Candidatus Enteromonas sp.]